MSRALPDTIDQAERNLYDRIRIDPVDLDFDSVEVAENFIRAGLLALWGDDPEQDYPWIELEEISSGDSCSRKVFYLDRVAAGGGKTRDLLRRLPAEFVDWLGSHCYGKEQCAQ